MENIQNNRFVPVQKIKELYRQKQIINKSIDDIISSYSDNHCQVCGDTSPKHGFYPLMGGVFGGEYISTSMLTCNRCHRTDEDYEKLFGEKKEIF